MNATRIAILLAAIAAPASAADWPMWRYDANRSAASPQELAPKLHLQWSRTYPPQRAAWPDQPLMQFDAAYEPVVAGRTMYLGSSRTDSLTAIDTRTGEERWRFFADGPIRFAPVAWEGRVYFVSDDGHLYCLDGEKGTLVWKFRGGPGGRLALGNERLISIWPARGAPVIADGTVYFAASIWPFMGIFIHAVDARTGKAVWTNDGDGSTYMRQPHNADSFAGVAPQGPLAVLGDRLLIPGGRSVPACYDRKTGKLMHYLLAENSKKGGGAEVAAIGPVFCNGGFAFDSKTGKSLGAFVTEPVLTEDTVYGFEKDKCRAYDLANAEVTPPKWKIADTGSFDFKAGCSLIKAGKRLVLGAPDRLVMVSLPLPRLEWPEVTWDFPLKGTPSTILAADDRLFVVTQDGRVLCFGAEPVDPKVYPIEHLPSKNDQWTKLAQGILDKTNAKEGYCISWGVGTGRLITALARRSKLHIVAVEPDAAKVKAAREALVASGLYGDRIAVIHADPMVVELPPYLASLMVSESLADAGIPPGEAFAKKAFYSLRPYGGVACFQPGSKQGEFAEAVRNAKLVNAAVSATDSDLLITREGALPGSDNWTHEHADAANTRVSTDDLVKAPLGVLWFGGPPNDGILPRHGHGPQPQVIDGRLIIEGVDKVRAIDIYTGRQLWETPLPGVGSFYDNTAHQPGANAAGTNFISTPEAIYIAYKSVCVKLDPATGKRLGEVRMPDVGVKKATPRWGYINVADDYLIGGADPLYDPKLEPKKSAKPVDDDDDKIKRVLTAIKTADNDNLSASKHLVVMNRHTGEVLWTAAARFAFRHNGICVGGGRLYAIDRLSGAQINRLKKEDKLPDEQPRVIAFDLKTGAKLWESEADVFGTWLSYSEKHDVLVEAGRVARDTLTDEPKGMRAYRAKTGDVMWFEKTYLGPAMIHGDLILKDRSACDILTGEPHLRPDPLTGEKTEWTWVRNYGCNTPLAAKNLMTFRSGAAGYLDLCNDGGTGNFGGFRSSCTNNLIVAGGVLCAPEYTRTCTCSYQNQSSICLVNMPEAEMWTSFGKFAAGKAPVRRVGVNFGAPGDRKAEDGTLWLEHPGVGGPSPSLTVTTAGKDVKYFRQHAARVDGPMNWVTSSGVSGVESITVALAPQPSKPKEVGGKKTEGGDEEPPAPVRPAPSKPRTYTVRLYFAEPEDLAPAQRLFDVSIQGQPVLKAFDVAKEAGGPRRSIVREFKGIKAGDDLRLSFKPSPSAEIKRPILCGLELIAEGW